MLKRILRDVLTPSECDQMVSAFDQIGSIIVVRIPESLLPKKRLIGRTLMEQVKAARSVFCQSSAVDGDYRTRELEIVAGEDDPVTEYRENGCRFRVDVRNAFFSPRLSTERERIASLVRDGEVVVNMFGGVGMFSIMAAKRSRCMVYNIDINPVASALCQANAGLNRLAGKVVSINGDAAEIVKRDLQETSDRTLMLLPERSDEFLGAAVCAAKDGSVIHYYAHIHADRKQDAGALSAARYMESSPVRSEVLYHGMVRAVGPRYYQTVVDARVFKGAT